MLQSIVIIGATSVVTCTLLALYLRRTIPKILDNVGEDIASTFKEIFADPMAKRAMSILGTTSGASRRESGAENALAEGILSNITPEIKIILDQIAPNIIEDYGAETVLRLVSKYAPMLSNFLPKSLNMSKRKGEYGSKY